jgi:DNA-binding Lrp family transcriptional regulator
MEKNENGSAVCSYALVKIGDREKLVPAVEKLYLNDHVLFCDAVDGDYDLVLLVQGNSDKELDQFITSQIKGFNGVHAVETCRLETSPAAIIESASEISGEDNTPERYDGSKAQSYLFVEADQEHLAEVQRQLRELPSVVTCDIAHGKYPMVALLKAAGFDLIRKIIAEKIRTLPGVLRVKQSHIIKLFEM